MSSESPSISVIVTLAEAANRLLRRTLAGLRRLVAAALQPAPTAAPPAQVSEHNDRLLEMAFHRLQRPMDRSAQEMGRPSLYFPYCDIRRQQWAQAPTAERREALLQATLADGTRWSAQVATIEAMIEAHARLVVTRRA